MSKFDRNILCEVHTLHIKDFTAMRRTITSGIMSVLSMSFCNAVKSVLLKVSATCIIQITANKTRRWLHHRYPRWNKNGPENHTGNAGSPEKSSESLSAGIVFFCMHDSLCWPGCGVDIDYGSLLTSFNTLLCAPTSKTSFIRSFCFY